MTADRCAGSMASGSPSAADKTSMASAISSWLRGGNRRTASRALSKSSVMADHLRCRPRWKAIANLRVNANLLNRINAILPVQTCFQKYIASRFTQISNISIPVLLPLRGVSPSSRTLGAGCDGRGWRQRRRRYSRTAKSCGPDASTPASSWREFISADDGDKKARSPGRARSKP